jgi:hypothetical protein
MAVKPSLKALSRKPALSRVESESSASGLRSRKAQAAWTRLRSSKGVTGISAPSWGLSLGKEIEAFVRQCTSRCAAGGAR